MSKPPRKRKGAGGGRYTPPQRRQRGAGPDLAPISATAPRHRPIPVRPDALRLFGVPRTFEEAAELVAAPGGSTDPLRAELVAADAAAMELTNRLGRWKPPFTRLAEGPFAAADIPSLRFMTARAALNTLDTLSEPPALLSMAAADLASATKACMGLASWCLLSPPYLLPEAVAPAVVESHSLDATLGDAIRLPHRRLTVWFGTALAVDVAALGLKLTPNEMGEVSGLVTLAGELPYSGLVSAMSVADQMSVVGLALASSADGRLSDEFAWLVKADLSDFFATRRGPGNEIYGAIPARLSATPLADLVRLVAATVAWGRWIDQSPEEADGGRGRGVATGAAATRTEHPIRVLNVARSTHKAARSGGDSSRRSPEPHLRAAHWRRLRCGPRDNWHYEGRWICESFVAGAVTFDPGRVYRLPVPLEAVDLPAISEEAQQ